MFRMCALGMCEGCVHKGCVKDGGTSSENLSEDDFRDIVCLDSSPLQSLPDAQGPQL